jgi:hypothetical protein
MQALFSFLRAKKQEQESGSDPAVKPKKQIKIVSQHGKEKSSAPSTGIGERIKPFNRVFSPSKEELEFF